MVENINAANCFQKAGKTPPGVGIVRDKASH